MKFSDVVANARVLLQDTQPEFRNSDAALLQFANDAVKVLATVRGELFTQIMEFALTAGSLFQQLPRATSLALVDVLLSDDDVAVEQVPRAQLNRVIREFGPAAGKARNWSPVNDDRHRFMVFPRPQAGAKVIVQHVAVPPDYDLEDDLPVPEAYAPAITVYVTAFAEAKDAEDSVPSRAKELVALFFSMVGATNG